MTGIRNKDIYGELSQENINKEIFDFAQKYNCNCDFYQSNHEGDIIDKIQQSYNTYDAIFLNAGAYTHYSYAIRDAIECIKPLPVYEIHMSDIYNREDFRKVSVIQDVCVKQFSGEGIYSYLNAIKDFLDTYEKD